MENRRPIEFNASVLSYAVVLLVNIACVYVPFFGWAFGLNFTGEWLANNALINGRKVVYRADYIGSLKFVSISALLIFVTFGIYSLWFGPKMYKYVTDHVFFVDAPTAPFGNTASLATQPPADPTA